MVALARWLRPGPPAAEGPPEPADEGVLAGWIRQNRPHVLAEPELRFPGFASEPLPPGERLLMYLPYEGMANQLNCLVRGMHLAATLNRTLLVSPLFASRHNAHRPAQLDWRHLLDFGGAGVRIRFLDAATARTVAPLLAAAPCLTYGRWKHLWVLGQPALWFAAHYGLQESLRLEWHDLPQQADRVAGFLETTLGQRAGQPLVCAANLQHLSFGRQADRYMRLLQPSDNVLKAAWDLLQAHGVGAARFGAVHWRRGDFAAACANKAADRCWPSLDVLRERIARASAEHSLDTFVIGTNDRHFALDMAELGVHIVVAQLPALGGPAEWAELAGAVMDMFLFTYADYFLGNAYSSLTRTVITRRSALGLQDRTATF